MASSALTFADGVREFWGEEEHALATDDIQVALFNSSWVTTTLTYSTTNELATANGYTQGGVDLTSETWSETTSVATFDAADLAPGWTASGGSIVFRYLVIWNNTSTTDVLLGYIIGDNTPADITVTDTSDLNVTWSGSGILTLS